MGELLWIKWTEILRIEYNQLTIDNDYNNWQWTITESDDERWVIILKLGESAVDDDNEYGYEESWRWF